MAAFWDVLGLVLLLISSALLVLAVVVGIGFSSIKLIGKRWSKRATWKKVAAAATTGLVFLALAGVVFLFAHPTLGFSQEKSDSLTAVATVSGDLVAAIIAGTTLYAVNLLRTGVNEQTKQLRSNAIQNIGHEMLEIDRWVVDHKGYREALERPATENSPLGAAVAEVYADLISQVVGQRDFLEDYYAGWDKYFNDIIEKWPQLKKYFDEHHHWYGDTLKYLQTQQTT
jgi:hypothetical protein